MLAVAAPGGCSAERLVAGRAVELAARSKSAFSQESDLELARAATPAALKQLEGFLLVAGARGELLRLLTEGFCGWGGFLQDEWEERVLERAQPGDELVASARAALARCARYATWQLPVALQGVLGAEPTGARASLAAARHEDAEPLYWLVSAHSTLLGITGELELALRVPRMIAILRRVNELAPGLLRGQAHLLLGVLLAATPVGGDLREAARQLDLARAASDGRSLMVDVLAARVYAVALGDRALFDSLLARVLVTSPASWPQERFSNELAQRLARRYQRLAPRWFSPAR